MMATVDIVTIAISGTVWPLMALPQHFLQYVLFAQSSFIVLFTHEEVITICAVFALKHVLKCMVLELC